MSRLAHDARLARRASRRLHAAQFRRARRLPRLLTMLLVVLALLVVAPRAILAGLAHGDVHERPAGLRELPRGEWPELTPRVALVLGAGVRRDGSPTPILADRIDGAVELYERDLVDVLVMSADNQHPDYDEPTAMRERAIEAGVPAADVVSDYAGRRTWDSCVRLREVFDVERAIVVTSAFHADRARASCARAGIRQPQVLAVPEDRFGWDSRTAWRTRELLAAARFGVDWLRRPEPAVATGSVDLGDPCSRWRSLSPDDLLRGPAPAGCD